MNRERERRETAGPVSQPRIKLWKAMRMSGAAGFQVRDLIALTGIERRKMIEKFVRPLYRAGYLRAERGGCARRYWLVKDTGPTPPRVSATGVVLDANAEVADLRKLHARKLKEIQEIEARLTRLGAYIEKYISVGEIAHG